MWRTRPAAEYHHGDPYRLPGDVPAGQRTRPPRAHPWRRSPRPVPRRISVDGALALLAVGAMVAAARADARPRRLLRAGGTPPGSRTTPARVASAPPQPPTTHQPNRSPRAVATAQGPILRPRGAGQTSGPYRVPRTGVRMMGVWVSLSWSKPGGTVGGAERVATSGCGTSRNSGWSRHARVAPTGHHRPGSMQPKQTPAPWSSAVSPPAGTDGARSPTRTGHNRRCATTNEPPGPKRRPPGRPTPTEGRTPRTSTETYVQERMPRLRGAVGTGDLQRVPDPASAGNGEVPTRGAEVDRDLDTPTGRRGTVVQLDLPGVVDPDRDPADRGLTCGGVREPPRRAGPRRAAGAHEPARDLPRPARAWQPG